MPKPVYILCSESGSEDKATGLVSHFKVLDSIGLRKFASPRITGYSVVPALLFQTTAVWERSEGEDPDQPYEYEVRFFLPPDGKEVLVSADKLWFPAPRRRFTINSGGDLFGDAGEFRVEMRIRPEGAGDDAWIAQSYSIRIIEAPAIEQDPIVVGTPPEKS